MIAIKSPLANHAFNPRKLPVPLPPHDLRYSLPPNGSGRRFESIRACREEDLKRAKVLINGPDEEGVELGEWLLAATHNKDLPLSPCSSVYMRIARRRLLGQVHEVLAPEGGTPARLVAFTLIRSDWYYPLDLLPLIDLKKPNRRLYDQLRQAGIVAADGVLFAAVHGEFDGDGYQLHFHGVASGDKAKLISSLSGQFGFSPTENIARPVRCTRIDDLPRWLSYCMKSYWPYRPRYEDERGRRKLGRRQRLPIQQQRDVYLWMARQNIFSMTIRSGFHPFSTGKPGASD